ncbi:MAG: cation transporter [Lentisphaerae bacterium]|nr:cation transporter [Lentisphaerota bacterium]
MPDALQRRRENRVINGGLVANALLAALKTTVGIIGHSNALLADGVNATSDVAYYVVVKVCLILAQRPPDREHPYGHRQLESIAAVAVGAFVVTTGIALFWGAVNDTYDLVKGLSPPVPVASAALWVALVTIVAKVILTIWSRRVARDTGNAAILALARDHRNDIVSGAGAALGILGSVCGLDWADPLVGAGVALVVLTTGVQILRESAAELMDAVPGDALETEVRAALAGVAGVRVVEEVLAHRFGPYFVVHVTIGIDGALSVRAGDDIASEVERALQSANALIRRVTVHYHPAHAT